MVLRKRSTSRTLMVPHAGTAGAYLCVYMFERASLAQGTNAELVKDVMELQSVCVYARRLILELSELSRSRNSIAPQEGTGSAVPTAEHVYMQRLPQDTVI